MNLTFDVNNISVVMPTHRLLTSDVMSEVKFSADIREEFGKWMQQMREDRGLTQKYVAKQIGVTHTQLSRIENGKSGTERDTVIKWAKVVGVDENETLRRFKPENNIVSPVFKKPTNVREFFEILDQLGLEVHFDGGMDKLETLDEEDLQEILDGVVATASAKAKRAYKNLQN